jgi:hypothetical protein
MTKISAYPTLSNPTEDDILIGTDVNSSDETRNFSIGSIIDLIGDINQGPIGPQGNTGPTGPQGPVGPAGLEWRGEWSSGTAYILDDAVGYDGASYFCVQAVGPSASTPDVDVSNWALLASQGAVGPTGPAGPIGPQGPQGEGTQTVKVQKTTITQAQILQLFTTPITILESTTAGVAKIPLNIMCKRSGTGTNYTIESNQFKLLANSTGSSFSMTLFNTFLTSTSDLVSYVNLSFNASSQLSAGVDNEIYKLGCYTSNPTSGTGDMDVYVTYIQYSI